MSTGPGTQTFGSFDDVANEFPLTPDEAERIADALGPAQQVAGIGSDVGAVIADSPGAGPQFVGSLLQTLSVQLDLAAVSVETLARAAQFYLATQQEAASQVFPPPSEFAAQARRDFEPLVELLREGGFEPP